MAPIISFAKHWKSLGHPIIATRFINTPTSAWVKFIGWQKLQTSPEIDLDPELAELLSPTEIIDKQIYSSLIPEVLARLNEYGSTEVLVCGIATDGCVLKTAVDLFEQSYRPIVLEDLTASHAGDAIHEAGLLLIRRFIGRAQVQPSSSWLPA